MDTEGAARSRPERGGRGRWPAAAAAVLVALAVGLTVHLAGPDEYRTDTMRPEALVCDASAEPTARTIARIPSSPDALLFGGETVHLPPSAARRVRHWIDRFGSPRYRDRIQGYFRRVHARAPEVRPVLREAGVPEEMLYLMLVESGGTPGAVSSARAVGMWQFMSRTAREMDLSVSTYFDTRRQPDASTRAAARYLREQYEEFGSWWLAMAAYNAGPHRVRRALRRAPGADYFELSERRLLPPQTREYVPKTLAALLIGREPGRWGFDPAPVPRETRRLDRLAVASGTTWEALSRAAGVPEGWLRRVNPEYPRDLVAAPDSARVRIPTGRGSRAASRLAEMPERERLGVLRHTVRPGETLRGIAARYGMPVDRVLAVNRDVDPRRLGVGSELQIPAER